MGIRTVTPDDLPAAMTFNNDAYRPETALLQPDFFAWQFDNCAGHDRTPDNGTLLSINGEVDGMCLTGLYEMNFRGQVRPGAWIHYWFTKPSAGPAGLLMFKRLTRHVPFLGGAAIDLQAATVMRALGHPMVWFELDRLMAVLDAERACELSFSRSEHTLPYLRALKPPTASTVVATESIVRFGNAYDALWANMRPAYALSTDRTSQFMNWRYVDHPRFEYQRLFCTGKSGPAVYVWRNERVQGKTWIVGRLCEAIGSPDALRETFPSCYRVMAKTPDAILADFSCSHAMTNAALVGGGMTPIVTRGEIDMPLRFQPVERQASPRLDFYMLFPKNPPPDFYDYTATYFTRGDSNQDRPL